MIALSKRTIPLLFLLCCLLLTACGDNEPTEGQKKNIAEMERIKKLQAGGKCADKNIIVEIDGMNIKVPRYGTDIDFKDGKELNGLTEVPYMCDLKTVNNVQLVRMPLLGFITARDHENWKQRILDLDKKQINENKIDGIKKIRKRVYLLPIDQFPTQNNDPVLIHCSNDPEDPSNTLGAMCNAGYIHPSGIGVGYRFFGNIEDFIKINTEKRKKADLFLINQQNKE